MNKNNIRKTAYYNEYLMYSPNGELMCKVNEKKFNWYIKNNLATKISETEIKLNFIPNGIGYEHKYFFQKFKNQCVICGNKENLTVHHVLPNNFRKYLPFKMRVYNAYDFLLLCKNCHVSYEIEAEKFKNELYKKYNISEVLFKMSKEEQTARKYAKTLYRLENKRKKENIPEDKRKEMELIVKEFFGTDYDVKEIIQSKVYTTQVIKTAGELLIKKLKTKEEIESFIFSWRKHFLNFAKQHKSYSFVRIIFNLNPKFFPSQWKVNHPV